MWLQNASSEETESTNHTLASSSGLGFAGPVGGRLDDAKWLPPALSNCREHQLAAAGLTPFLKKLVALRFHLPRIVCVLSWVGAIWESEPFSLRIVLPAVSLRSRLNLRENEFEDEGAVTLARGLATLPALKVNVAGLLCLVRGVRELNTAFSVYQLCMWLPQQAHTQQQQEQLQQMQLLYDVYDIRYGLELQARRTCTMFFCLHL